MDIILLRLITVSAMPVIFAALFYQLEKRPRWQSLSYRMRQTIIGVAFGLLAVLSTEFGVPVDGAVLNVRSAPALISGLLFGCPAGLIAGFIGGLERWFATYWGAGEFTRLAGSLATVIAGMIGAGVRFWLLDDRKPGWFQGLALGAVTEVLHMLLALVINGGEIHRAFAIVQKCAVPMIIANGASVMTAAWVVSIMKDKKLRPTRSVRRISQTFQRWLFVCVLAAFSVTMLFIINFQTSLARANTETVLYQSLEDVEASILDMSDQAMLSVTEQISRNIPSNVDVLSLQKLSKQYRVTEISIIDKNGIIISSSIPEYVGFNMHSGPQSAAFLCLLSGETRYVQNYQPITIDPTISRKYAGVATNVGFVQVGYDASRFQIEINEQVQWAARHRRIGQNGYILICDEDGLIISDNGSHTGETISALGHRSDKVYPEKEMFQANILGQRSYCMFVFSEGYAILAIMPMTEALFFRDTAVYALVFMETLVFAVLFAYIYFLIRRLIVNNIHKINHSLSLITGGDLNVTVDVRSNEEFANLSDDINTTVDALRRLIDEAAARIDKELEIARQIQLSTLPSAFPAYPSRKEFEIFAAMHTAKEVGGDFYDFYFCDNHTLIITVADVSDKGIPAAMFMMQAKALLKRNAGSGIPLNEAFDRANQVLHEGNDTNMFVTAWAAKIDLLTGSAAIVNAGHNPPLYCAAGQPSTYHKTRAGLVMAVSDLIRYRQSELQLHPGDLLFLYTDGITEATNAQNELYGEDRLQSLMDTLSDLPPEEICRRVKEDVDAFVGDAPQFDDMTMLALRYKGGNPQ